MANPSADYPTAIHTAQDISANANSALGDTSPTHTQVEGKQEEEIKAIQTKVGIGASNAADASDGDVLTKQADGSTAWETGVAGSQGDTGVQGDTGAAGAAGAKGDTGSAGAQGDTGAAGAAGAKGDTGSTGAQGDQGDTGATGSQGAKGDTGSAGAQGDTGATGSQGVQGDTGVYGGNSFRYQFSTTTTDADPGSGFLRFNNATYSSVTEIYIDDEEEGGVDIQAWLRTLDDANNSVDGFLRIFEESDPTDWAIFKITALSEETGYFKLTVTAVDDEGTFANNGNVVVSFVPAGDKGDTGTAGAQGDTGATGSTGAKGDTGSAGAQGDTGATGSQGDTGTVSDEWNIDSTPDSDHTVSGMIGDFTANENQNFGDVCYIDANGEMALADADAIATAVVIGMCADASIAADASGDYLLHGVARDDTWNWTVGGLVYLSLTGTTGNTLTQTAPSATDDCVVIIGVATHADRIYFRPQLVIVEHT